MFSFKCVLFFAIVGAIASQPAVLQNDVSETDKNAIRGDALERSILDDAVQTKEIKEEERAEGDDTTTTTEAPTTTTETATTNTGTPTTTTEKPTTDGSSGTTEDGGGGSAIPSVNMAVLIIALTPLLKMI